MRISQETDGSIFRGKRMEENKVLVTAIGSAAAGIVIKELHQYGWRVVGTDIYPKEWLVDSFQVERFYQVPRAEMGEEFIDGIIDICRKEDVRYIIPLTDVEVDAFHRFRMRFSKLGICLCMQDEGTVSLCRDKRKTAMHLKGYCHVISEVGRDKLAGWKDFPLICKKTNGRSSQGLYRFSSVREICAFMEDKGDEYMIQPMMEGEVITADVLRDRDNDRCIVYAREELLRTGNGLGIAVKMFHDACFEEKCREIAKRLDILGCVNFEFIRNREGAYYFMECNPRFSGGVEFSVLAGYHFIYNHMNCFLGKGIDEACIPKMITIARRYEGHITGIRE